METDVSEEKLKKTLRFSKICKTLRWDLDRFTTLSQTEWNLRTEFIVFRCGIWFKGKVWYVAEKTGWDKVYQVLEIVLLQNHYRTPGQGVGRMAYRMRMDGHTPLYEALGTHCPVRVGGAYEPSYKSYRYFFCTYGPVVAFAVQMRETKHYRYCSGSVTFLVRIRLRILGSLALTNGSGCGCGPVPIISDF
jgi:hypothetical protein